MALPALAHARTLRGDPGILVRKVQFGLARVFGRRGYARFILLGRSRTGSNLLLSLINRHPSLHCQSEVFRDRRGQDLPTLYARAFPRYPKRIRAGGVKVFYYHPRDDDSGELWHGLHCMQDLAVIHLKRRNLLRSIVSQRIAQTTGLWRSVDGHPTEAAKRIWLAEDELRQEFASLAAMEAETLAYFQGHAVLNITYEELAADMRKTLHRVTGFLGVDPINPATHLRRQNPEPLRNLIVNFDALRDAFEDSSWAWMFDERARP